MPLLALICSANTSSSQATRGRQAQADEEAGQRAGQHDPPDAGRRSEPDDAGQLEVAGVDRRGWPTLVLT